MKLTGKRALVTGASSGIGKCFAQRLAGMGADVVLCARRKDRLEELAAELRERYKIQATPLPLDLSGPGAAQELFDRTEGAAQPIDLLINNAGYAIFESFTDTPYERIDNMLRLNILALTQLTHLFAKAMLKRKRGHILNVASFAAYIPVPNYAAYAASKAYVRNFTEAVAHELRKQGVRVCCVCPGSTSTEFWEVAGHTSQSILIRAAMSSPDFVARKGLKALLGWRRNIVVGIPNKLTAFFTRLVSRRTMVFMASLIGAQKDKE